MKKLHNKTALITGGTSGIGLATAKALIAEGATVIITGRNAQAVEKAAGETGATGFVSDQTSLPAIDQLVERVKQQFGKIDILFPNAGTVAFMPLELATEEHFDAMFNVNVKGVYFMTQKFLSIMNRGGAVIYNTAASAGMGVPGSSAYASSKAAVLSMTRIFATELAPRNIRVNAISSAAIETPIMDNMGMSKEEMEGFRNIVTRKVLLNRFGQSEEIAKTVLFLVSDDSSFITGSEIKVDGGISVNTF